MIMHARPSSASAVGARTAALLRAVGAEVTTCAPREAENFEPDLARASTVLTSSPCTWLSPRRPADGIDAALLERLALGATVVNTARPAVVDRAAMLAALELAVGAYAVDGFEPEPPDPADPLLAHPG